MIDRITTASALRIARDFMESQQLPVYAVNVALDVLEGTRPADGYDELIRDLRRKEAQQMNEDALCSIDGLTDALTKLAPILKQLTRELQRYNNESAPNDYDDTDELDD